MRDKILCFIFGLWLLVCIVWGMDLLSRFMTLKLSGSLLLVRIIVGSIAVIWFGFLTFIFLRRLTEIFSVGKLKLFTAVWFMFVMGLHFLLIQKNIATTAIMPHYFDVNIVGFSLGLLGALPFVLLTIIAKEGK